MICGAGAMAARQLRKSDQRADVQEQPLKEEITEVYFATTMVNEVSDGFPSSSDATLFDIEGPSQYLSPETLEMLNEEQSGEENSADDISSASDISESSSDASTDSEFVYKLPAVRRNNVTRAFPEPLHYLHPTVYMDLMRSF
eukprot:TRINITY_DN7181_c0_g2_i1.p1 TRINITY_DN7181_c0_g2~~TRINITY_DN7181_c0_g2_i1.p1  ORF type:complete len:143 (-),score=22.69 TRINITY_DN7181_c0_g2_i1:28-456(-)